MPKKVDDDGNLVLITPQETIWWSLYVESPPLNNRQFIKKFRRRFRMPHTNFVELCNDIREHELFLRWGRKDATGKNASPIELLLLGTLRYLGWVHLR